MVDVELIHVFPGDHIDHGVPFPIEALELMEPFNLMRR